MTTFRTRRYALALLLNWSIPFVLGFAFAYPLASWSIIEMLRQVDQSFFDAVAKAVSSCAQ